MGAPNTVVATHSAWNMPLLTELSDSRITQNTAKNLRARVLTNGTPATPVALNSARCWTGLWGRSCPSARSCGHRCRRGG